MDATAGSVCQPVDSCLHVQLRTGRGTYVLHIRGQINSAVRGTGSMGRPEMDYGATSLITIQAVLF